MKRPSARTALRFALGTYVVLLHAALLVLVLKTNFLLLAGKTLGLAPPEEWNPDLFSRVMEQAEEDHTVQPGQVVLVGDSAITRLETRLLDVGAVNFGIGGDTTRTLYGRLSVIRSARRSRAVVLEVGVNDLKYRSTDQIARDYDALLDRLSFSSSILAVSVLPVDEGGSAARERSYLRNDAIAEVNQGIKRVCGAHKQCRFLDAWPAMLNKAVYSGDGWHLSAEGSEALAGVIRSALPAPE